jgi:hypothetical protein
MDLTKLSKVIDLCRKKGVAEIEIEGIRLSFGSLPPKRPYVRKSQSKPSADEMPFPTPEQLLNWSVT